MSYLIKDTTVEERENIVNKALAILLSDASMPSDDVIELSKKYINGDMELEDIQRIVINKYKVGGNN